VFGDSSFKLPSAELKTFEKQNKVLCSEAIYGGLEKLIKQI